MAEGNNESNVGTKVKVGIGVAAALGGAVTEATAHPVQKVAEAIHDSFTPDQITVNSSEKPHNEYWEGIEKKATEHLSEGHDALVIKKLSVAAMNGQDLKLYYFPIQVDPDSEGNGTLAATVKDSLINLKNVAVWEAKNDGHGRFLVVFSNGNIGGIKGPLYIPYNSVVNPNTVPDMGYEKIVGTQEGVPVVNRGGDAISLGQISLGATSAK